MSTETTKAWGDQRRKVQEHLYRERVRAQTLAWAQGNPQHNRIDNECCPDFSCCQPDMLEQDAAKRWAHYHEEYGRQQ